MMDSVSGPQFIAVGIMLADELVALGGDPRELRTGLRVRRRDVRELIDAALEAGSFGSAIRPIAREAVVAGLRARIDELATAVEVAKEIEIKH